MTLPDKLDEYDVLVWEDGSGYFEIRIPLGGQSWKGVKGDIFKQEIIKRYNEYSYLQRVEERLKKRIKELKQFFVLQIDPELQNFINNDILQAKLEELTKILEADHK